MLSFGIKGGAVDVGRDVVDRLRLASNLANVGEYLLDFLSSLQVTNVLDLRCIR